jgi:hypothetical protein
MPENREEGWSTVSTSQEIDDVLGPLKGLLRFKQRRPFKMTLKTSDFVWEFVTVRMIPVSTPPFMAFNTITFSF